MQQSAPILVTGATGFLGRHLLERMQGKFGALALVRSQDSWAKMDWTKGLEGVDLVEGAIEGIGTWSHDPKVKKLGGILHLAALVKHSRHGAEETYTTNIGGTLNMVRLAAKRGCRMVFVSTSGTVGCFDNQWQKADETAPYCERKVRHWPYYHSKVIAEKKAMALAKELGVELVIIRPPMMLGPGDHRFRATSNMIRLMRGQLPFLIKGGMHYVDIRDAADAILAALTMDNPKNAYNLPGTMCSVDEFFESVGRFADTDVPKLHLPARAAHTICDSVNKVASLVSGGHKTVLPDPVVIEMGSAYWGLSSRYADKDLGFSPRPGEETIRDTVNWLKAEHPAL